jgi:hypothetical protein
MDEYIYISANELVSLIELKQKTKLMLESVEVADLNNQYNPSRCHIGYGGICTLKLKVIE